MAYQLVKHHKAETLQEALFRSFPPVSGRPLAPLRWSFSPSCYFGTRTSLGKFYRGKIGRDRADVPCASTMQNQICTCSFNAPRHSKFGMNCLYNLVSLTCVFLLFRKLFFGGVDSPLRGDRCSLFPAGSCGYRGMLLSFNIPKSPFRLLFRRFWLSMIRMLGWLTLQLHDSMLVFLLWCHQFMCFSIAFGCWGFWIPLFPSPFRRLSPFSKVL